MRFTTSEIDQLAITFVQEHADQIVAKAASYKEPIADVRQDLIVIILELSEKYDPSKGTLEQFFFGHFEKRRRRIICAHKFAISLDQHGDDAERARAYVESLPAEYNENHNEHASALNGREEEMVNLILDRISGKSTVEISHMLGVTPRRVRQIFQELAQARPGSKKFIKLVTLLHTRLQKPKA
jgi:hypothetical protein